ncbi:MAG: Fic family protein [Betaproteobacteria bacterium]|nr:Fic family protein [Betaproteobacteria bacterium]
MWIHENKNWPEFVWDIGELYPGLLEARQQLGHLLGRMDSLGFEHRQEANLRTLTGDLVRSWAIEGERLDERQVRSSVARRLGIDIGGLTSASRHVEGAVEMMLDATSNFRKPLTAKRLFAWHKAIFPAGDALLGPIVVGNWRPGAMQIVSGPYGRQKLHYQAPSAARVADEMKKFLSWFESRSKIDSLLKAGVAHLWFESIHPFEDGNGRIGRAIADLALARADGRQQRFYSLSAQFEANRNQYYQQLEMHNRGSMDITGWLAWFVASLSRALERSEQTLAAVMFKARLWNWIGAHPVNDRQRQIINRMLEDSFEGHMNTSKYAKMAKCSANTAGRDIDNLKSRGILVRNPGSGRSTSYRLVDRVPN